MKISRLSVLILSAVFSFLISGSAEAAILFMSPKSGEVSVGQSFDVSINVNSEGKAFNAAQATIEFPVNLLEVKSVDSTANSSLFDFWLDGPAFSNKEGKINFIGGSGNGVSGKAIPILKITFIAKAVGEAPLTFSDTAVTAADGLGTNILTTMEVATFRVLSKAVSPAVSPAAPITPVIIEVVPAPTIITRTPTAAKKVPAKPAVSVALYPDQEKWYNARGNFLAKWDLPSDISDVSSALDKNYSFLSKTSEGLFDSKVFPAIMEDGVWYAHVKFKNNVGWGPVANYRIGIDTMPPHPFKIGFIEGALKSENPSPVIKFSTSDGLSGMDYYEVSVDGGDMVKVGEGKYKLPVLAPGIHPVIVRATDKAGNSIEDSVDLEIIPISSPVINFIKTDVFVGEGTLAAGGTSLVDTVILLEIKKENNEMVYKSEVTVDKDNNWETTIDQLLKKGRYYFEIKAKDSRGALSMPVRSDLLRVREKPLFALAGFEVTQTWFFMGIIVILLIGFGLGWLSYRLWLSQVKRRTVIAKRDIEAVYNVIFKDVEEALKRYSDDKLDKREISDIKFLLQKIKTSVEKMKKYVLEGVEEITE